MVKHLIFFALITSYSFSAGQTTIDTLFFDDFEGDSLLWEEFICPAQWHTTTLRAYSGKSWWCGNESLDGYSNCWYQILTTPEISLPSSPSGILKISFMLDMAIEPPPASPSDVGGLLVDGWDGFHITISTDGGDSWQLLIPADGYDCDTMFGFIQANDSLWQGWGGSTDGWIHKEATLNSFAGEDVKIRFVFAADPFFDTNNDSTMFGVLLDDIAVYDDDDTFFYDDGEDTISSPMTTEDTRPCPVPEITDIRAFDGEHSLLAADEHLAHISIVTPQFFIDDGFLANGSFRIFRDTPDDDDFYVIYISTDGGISWVPMGKDDGWESEWQLVYGADGIAEPYIGMLFYDYIGDSVKLMLTFIFDNDDGIDTGDGFFIDDFCISGIYGNTYDAGVSAIYSGPINVNQDVIFNAEITGYGIEAMSPAVYYKIFSDEDVLITSGFLGSADVSLNQHIYEPFVWRPVESGDYYVVAWTTSAHDEDNSNDSAFYYFSVPDENHRELGYDDAVQDSFYSESGGRYFYYLIPGFDSYDEVGDGYAVDFELPFDYATLDSIKILGKGEGNIVFGIFGYDGGVPSSLPEATFSASLPDAGLHGEWFKYVLEEPFVISHHNFFVGVWADTESYFWIGIDNTSPHDRRSWRIDPEGDNFSFQNTTELSSPYDDFDFIMRCFITRVENVADIQKPGITPFLKNIPNPFNGSTEIDFYIPWTSHTSLVLCDISGKIVRHLLSRKISSGRHKIKWDGRDDDGNLLRSGIYFARIEAKNVAISKKVVIVK